MLHVRSAVTLVCISMLCGCFSQGQFLNQNEPAALATAQRRAMFDLNCPDVNTTVLSRKVIQAAMVASIPRAEYTIGVRGCGRQVVYWTMCVDQNNCNALSDTGRVESMLPQ